MSQNTILHFIFFEETAIISLKIFKHLKYKENNTYRPTLTLIHYGYTRSGVGNPFG